MTDESISKSQTFQTYVIERVREIQRMLDREVVEYYRADRVDDEADATENLRGLHNYLKRAYKSLDALLTEIENRPEFKKN